MAITQTIIIDEEDLIVLLRTGTLKDGNCEIELVDINVEKWKLKK